jgi:phosphoserine phosphatase
MCIWLSTEMETTRIALVFDFDDTLVPDSTSGFLEYIGIQPLQFWMGKVDPLLAEDWDPGPAYLYALLETSKHEKAIHREDFTAYARSIIAYPGLTRLLEHLRSIVKLSGSSSEIEFYIISSGIGEIIRNCPIAGYFTDIWAGDFHYDSDGTILFPKKVISFTDKTRYLFQINKGLIGGSARGKPFEVNKRVKPGQIRIPFRNFIYVGDGYTDIPCFSLVKQHEGFAIGVYDKHNPKKREMAWAFVQDERVSNLLSVDYSEGSDLSDSLEMAVKSIMDRSK